MASGTKSTLLQGDVVAGEPSVPCCFPVPYLPLAVSAVPVAAFMASEHGQAQLQALQEPPLKLPDTLDPLVRKK